MLRLIAIVISIAAADAVNPSTLVPALLIASRRNALGQVLSFCAGVLGVEFGFGLVLVLGPGELILDLVPTPTPHVVDWIQLGAGIALLVAAPIVWRLRGALGRRVAGSGASEPSDGAGRSSLLLGAGIVAVGMPTNVAYLGGLTTIVGSDRGVGDQLLLLCLYDAIFILPLAAIIAILAVLPHRAERLLGAMRRFLEQRLVTALTGVLIVAGAVVLVLGLSGLIAS